MNSVSEKTINLSQIITLCGGGVLKSGKIIEEVKQFYLGWIILNLILSTASSRAILMQQ